MLLGSKPVPVDGVLAVALHTAACGLLDAPALASVDAPGLDSVDAAGLVTDEAAGLAPVDALVLAAALAAVLDAGNDADVLAAADTAAVLGRDVCGAVVPLLPPPQATTRTANVLSNTSGRFAIVPPQEARAHGRRATPDKPTRNVGSSG